jgi:hypothetical protein
MNRPVLGALIGLCAVALTLPLSAHAQSDDLSEALGSIGTTYADHYTQPVTDALGAGLNAGLFRTAEVGGTGLVPGIDVYVGASAVGVFTAGSADSFRPETEQFTTDNGRTVTIEYNPEEVPTVFGEEESPGTATISDDQGNSTEVELPPGLLNTSIAPLAVPQVGVGTVLGTDAQLRYLPETDISNYGSVSLVGLSVRHSLSQYIPLSPVDLAVQGTWQSLSVSGTEQDGVVDASGWALNAQASKSLPLTPVTVYGGLQYEQFGVDVNYTFRSNVGTQEVAFEQDAANSVRALAGVSVTLAVVQLNVDYALGANNTVSAGLGVTL